MPTRARIIITGIVQGVGFRPFVYRLARDLHLTGWVKNGTGGVIIEAEGTPDALAQLYLRLRAEHPPHANIVTCDMTHIPPQGDAVFRILPSDVVGEKSAHILPDLATCPACLAEMTTPSNRRYRYPFINCTDCGARYSLMTALPYDRPNTTMRDFVMCDACHAEYHDPADRRFHAQPNACPVCGPHIALWDADGTTIATDDDALGMIVDGLRRGMILALKGVGGFHLMADAHQHAVIARLRERKHRPHKPFAVMFPALDMLLHHCHASQTERTVLQSASAPIVLLDKKHTSTLADNIAPDSPTIGAFLPYSPLHHLLLADFDAPLVATSGNRSDEPICTDEHEALDRLRGIADLFLVHDRPIARPIDDSVVRVMLDEAVVIRRARGYAPTTISVHHDETRMTAPPPDPLPTLWRGGENDTVTGRNSPLHAMGRGFRGGAKFHPAPSQTILAVGAHQKNTIAIRHGDTITLSQHIGDLTTVQAQAHFEQTIADLSAMLAITPAQVVCDAHPDYASTAYAQRTGLPITHVQHHYAHALACMAEHGINAPALAVVWDGTGYGDDGTIWGGEFLHIGAHGYRRVGHIAPFPLLGGESAVHHPAKTALGWLYSVFGDAVFDDESLAPVRQFTSAERRVLRQMVARGINCPITTSMGRMFDAVASLLDLCHISTHEAQAAVMLENLALSAQSSVEIAYMPQGHDIWATIAHRIIADQRAGVPVATISRRFHATLVHSIVQMAQTIGEKRVLLSGGCFLNKPLLEGAVIALREAGFDAYWHRQIPPGDGGIALGQTMAAIIV